MATGPCAKQAELLEIYPTLTELLELAQKEEIDHQTNFLPLFCSSGRCGTPYTAIHACVRFQLAVNYLTQPKVFIDQVEFAPVE